MYRNFALLTLRLSSRLRHRGAGYGPRHDEARWMPYAGLPTSDSGGVLAGSAYDRKVNEMQASLNLLGLKQSRSENIDQLTAALLVSAYLHRALLHRPTLFCLPVLIICH